MTKLATIRPTVTFLHGDGSFAEASPRAIRAYKAPGAAASVLVVERRKRLLPIRITGPRTAEVNLGATPVLADYGNAQDVAPVVTNEQLGIKREPKAAGDKAASSKPAKAASKLEMTADAAIAMLGKQLAGASQGEAQALFLSIVEAANLAKPAAAPAKTTRRRKA